MLLEEFKNKNDEVKIKGEWCEFNHKNGHKGITVDNFLKLGYTFCHYRVEDKYYEGYFTQTEIDFIFAVLNYHAGKILSLAG